MQRIIGFYCLLRKLGLALALIGIGYLLGNAFPTFEVRRLTDSALPMAVVTAEGCAPLCEDFDDKIKIGE
jgi:TctA family transporter